MTVNNTNDNGAGSLRAAVAQANSDGGGDTIQFDPTVFSTPQTITLTGGQLELTGTTAATTITGPAAGVTVSGNEASRVFQFDPGVVASISGLTITGGNADGVGGGGLFIEGMAYVFLTDCTVSGNSAGFNGGGLFNDGMATLTDCTVSGNSTGGAGGGLCSFSTAELTDCTVSGNLRPSRRRRPVQLRPGRAHRLHGQRQLRRRRRRPGK